MLSGLFTTPTVVAVTFKRKKIMRQKHCTEKVAVTGRWKNMSMFMLTCGRKKRGLFR